MDDVRRRHKKKALKKHVEGRPLTWREREYVESIPIFDIFGAINSVTEAIVWACEKLAEWVVEGAGLAINALVGILGACNEQHREQHCERMRFIRSGISVSAKEEQFLEVRKFQESEIARIYGVPLSLIQGQSGKEDEESEKERDQE